MLFWLIVLAVPCFKAPWFYELLSKCLNWVRCSLPGFDEYLITSQNNPKKLIFARVMFCGINFRKDYFCKLWANLLKKSAKRWPVLFAVQILQQSEQLSVRKTGFSKFLITLHSLWSIPKKSYFNGHQFRKIDLYKI